MATKVYNTSGQPIYDVRVHWLDAGSGVQVGVEDKLWTIGPGQERRIDRPVPDNVAPSDFTVVAYFRDSAALRWTLTTAGHLATVEPSLQAGAPLIATTALSRSPYSTKHGASEAQVVTRPADRADSATLNAAIRYGMDRRKTRRTALPSLGRLGSRRRRGNPQRVYHRRAQPTCRRHHQRRPVPHHQY